MSVGSPATASFGNSEPIAVDLVQIDAAGQDIIVGSYQLRPGASVDVSALARAPGRDGEFRFKVLKGSVSVTASGRTRTLKPGERATMLIDRISAILPLPAR
jgi:hypothetical protein